MTNICIDLGGTYIKGGLIEEGVLKYYDATASESDTSFGLVMNKLETFIDNLLKITKTDKTKISGIGICMPGIINVDQNKVIAINAKHAEAIHFDFTEWSLNKYGVKLTMENDARAALVGEWVHGLGVGYNNIAMMTIGTGIGGAAMINGKLLHGKHYQAGCLGGHFTININGTICNCGNKGCVESEASSWMLEENIKNNQNGDELLKLMDGEVSFQKLFEQKRNENPIASNVVNQKLKAWSAGVVNLIHAYDPEIVIISGGVMKSKDDILPYIKEYVHKHAWLPNHSVEVIVSEETDNIALWGMNYLISKKNSNN